jgi:superfamily II DNA or RNA helicase
MATGSGKTVVFSHLIHEHPGASAAIAHRREIVSQIACSLAELGIKHRIIAPRKTIQLIRRKQLKRFGQSFVCPNALCGVISVQTLTSKHTAADDVIQRWVKQVTLAVFDEGHHYTASGFWSRAVEQFNHALLLFVTATPERADGKGLSVRSDGYVEEMIDGPQTWELIREGYLSPFVYRAPASDLDVSGIPLTASGDFNARQFRQRIVKSHLVGDIIEQYKKYGNDGRAIVFATDVETAEEIAVAARAAGITALALSAKSHESDRTVGLDKFESGEIKWLVNVDLFDEGFDVPAAEVCIMARPTESTAKYLQMVGRVLRPRYWDSRVTDTAADRREAIRLGPKPNAVIIDPVRNWERHGLPNWPRSWSLDGRERGTRAAATDLQQLRVCTNCTQPFEAYLTVCPYCGAPVEYGRRSAPDQVDGDLLELDQDALAAVFARMAAAEQDDETYQRGQIARYMPAVGRPADMKRHRTARYRRGVLRHLLGWWFGMQPERSMSEKYRRFYFRFGVDVATALTLNAKETDGLCDRIAERFMEDMV